MALLVTSVVNSLGSLSLILVTPTASEAPLQRL
jgi:hypothetical protein